MTLMLQGFLLGLANGVSCLTTCAPVLLPYMVGEGRSVRQSTLPVTEYFEVSSFERLLQAFIFVGLFLALVVVLPNLEPAQNAVRSLLPDGSFSIIFQ